MNRTWPALLLSAVAIGVLLALIYASRPLGSEVYERHHGQLSALTASADDYRALLAQLEVGRREPAQLRDALARARTRLEQGAAAVGAAGSRPSGDSPEFQRYTDTLSTILSNTREAEQQLSELVSALAALRDAGPVAVQHLRDTEAGSDAERFYSLWLAVYEYGLGGSANAAALKTQLAAFNPGGAPAAQPLLVTETAMGRVLNAGETLENATRNIRQANLADAAATLASSLSAQHARGVEARNNARVLVSLYSVLLLAGLGFVVYRLHRSNRELEAAHAELQRVNVELEDRVEARTEDVQKAYDDLQRSQVQLVQAEKMSSLGQLVAGISHEINTPLLYLQSNTSLSKETLLRIADFLDLCHDKLTPLRHRNEPLEQARARAVAGLKHLKATLIEDEVREELREVLALIDDNLEGLEELTQLAQGLKDFSRLDRAPLEQFNLNDGVKRTLTIAKNMLKRHVKVTTNLGDIPAIRCAPSQINQVLLNLITNASQAIEGQGEIEISTSVEHGFVVARVRDTGSGISPDIVHKIRDPFFTTKEVGSGTGLGLSIVEEIVSKHKGRLAIDSTVGAGSTFSVYLPIGTGAAPQETAAAEPPTEAKHEPSQTTPAAESTELPAAAKAEPSKPTPPAEATELPAAAKAEPSQATPPAESTGLPARAKVDPSPPTPPAESTGLPARTKMDSPRPTPPAESAGLPARAKMDPRPPTPPAESAGPPARAKVDPPPPTPPAESAGPPARANAGASQRTPPAKSPEPQVGANVEPTQPRPTARSTEAPAKAREESSPPTPSTEGTEPKPFAEPSLRPVSGKP